MKSPSTFSMRGLAAAFGRLAAALALSGVYVLASAQPSPGTINVSANVYGLSFPQPSPATGFSNNGSTATASSFLYDPVNMDFSGTASASGTGGGDPSITLSTTGSEGSSAAYTPYNYTLSGTIDYSFEVNSAMSDQVSEILITGNVSASGDLFYPAMFDITSTAATTSDEDLLIDYFEPEIAGSTLNYGLSSPASQDFVLALYPLTDTAYTITYS